MDSEAINAAYLAIRPTIVEQLEFLTRGMKERDEIILNADGLAFQRFHELATSGNVKRAFPTSLARYVFWQTLQGRAPGCHLNSLDVLSRYAQRRRGFLSGSIYWADEEEKNRWKELAIEEGDNPADIVQALLDISAWFSQLGAQMQRVAQLFAEGGSTKEIAELLGLSCGRVSQIRDELRRRYSRFQDEEFWSN